MSTSSQSKQSVPPPTNTNISVELAHVTQDMYKKNFELVERNKTLSLLRKIHEIILSSVTDLYQIAQQAADTVAVDAEFKGVVILLLDPQNNHLERLAVSQTDQIAKAEVELGRSFYPEKLLLNEDENVVVRSIKEKKVQISHNLLDILKPYVFPNEVERMQGTLHIESSLVYPFVVRGQIIGAMIICLGESETELFKYQQDLIERLAGIIGIALDNALLYQELHQANETLKQLDKLKDEFVSLASHELRTPMTAIKSYLWMAMAGKGGELSEKQKYYLDRAYRSTDRLIKLVNDMLNVSRIESGRITLSLQAVKLDKLVSDVVAEIMPRAQELGVSLIFTPPASLPNVEADPDKIREVLINLIGNSLKFTPQGGNATLTLSSQDDMVITKVSDTGKGIKKEDMPKLFQKFATLKENYLVKQNAQGTGLGLYISKALIDLHGGKIWVESDGEGKGATFYFALKIFKQ